MKVQTITRKSQNVATLICWLAFILFQCPQVSFALPANQENIHLEEAFHRIGQKYDVYFNYDRSIASDITVQYDDSHRSLEEALNYVLKNTNLGYRIFDQRFVVVFQNNDQGIESLKEMIGHVQGFVDEREAVKKYTSRSVTPLETLTAQKVYKKRLVFGVSGQVVDDAGEPLIGVNIQVKGTDKGTATDFEGQFTLDDIDENAVLVVSYIGYQTLEVSVAGKTTLTITMVSDSQLLDEVVVVGYGTQKKVNLTGAVDVIGSAQLENRQSSTVSQLMQGLSPGLDFSIGNNGFEPGAEMNINIRGLGSINGGAPLVIIDGFPGDLDKVNPEDIESISILKDAAASAIYGARAPYGVIMVNTKSGKRNTKLSATYSGNIMLNTPSNLPHMVDSYTYARVLNEAGDNGGGRPYSTEEIDRIIAYQRGDFDFIRMLMPENIRNDVKYYQTIPDPNSPNEWLSTFNAHANNDFFDIWYGNSVNQKHNFTLQGGSDNTSYYISAGYLDQEGVLNYGTDTYDRINVLAKINTSITDWWDIRYEPRIIKTNRIRPSNQNGDYSIVFHQIARTYPTNPVYDGFGNYDTQSKIPWTEYGGTSDTEQTINWHTFATEIRPTKGWRINADFAYKSLSEFMSKKRPTVYEYLVDGTSRATSNTVPSSIHQFHTDESYWTSNVYSSLEMLRNKNHNLLIMIGAQSEYSKGQYLNAFKTNLLSPGIPSLETASGNPSASETLNHRTTQGVFGRLNYNYKERYLIEANGRYDGSSVFKSSNRWGFFPSFSLGWNVDKESFWDGLGEYINSLKIRGSWGKLGNQNISPYSDIALVPLQSSPLNYIFRFGSSRPIGYTSTPRLVSPNLTWETAVTTNFGVDFSSLENRLQVEFNWFQRLTNDMIGPVEAQPGVLGANVPLSNNASLRTRGWELSLGWNQFVNNRLGFHINGNIADYRSIITEYYNPTNILSTWYEGKESGEIWGYTANGLYQSIEELNTYRDQIDLSEISNTWNPGDIKYEDINGDGKVNTGSNTLNDPGDLSIIGNSSPRYQYGLSLGVDFEGFDLSILLKGVGKREEWFNGAWFNYWGIRWTFHNVVTPEHLDYFRDQPGDGYAVGLNEGDANINLDAFWPKYYLDIGQNNRNREPSDRYLADLSYLRIQNIQLGYTLPDKIATKIKMQKLRIYLSGENLYTFHNLPVKGIDPVASIGSLGAGSTYGADIILSFGISLRY